MERILPLVMMIGFWVMGTVQLFATYDFFRYHWHWHWLLSVLVTGVLGYFPFLGSISGSLGAIYVWHWVWWKAGLLFYWWPCIFLVSSLGVLGANATMSIRNRFQKWQ